MNKTQALKANLNICTHSNLLEKLQQLSKCSLKDSGLVQICLYFHVWIFVLTLLKPNIRVARISNHNNLKENQRR